jgi:N-acyl homoserine lactone hydrolase
VKLDDVRAIQYGDVLVEGERWPNSIHVIEHPDGRILVDTGMIDSTPELDELLAFIAASQRGFVK